jgi:hypothetical protein
MILHCIGPGKDLRVYELHEALVTAGSADSDSEFTKDFALEQWLEGRRYQVIEFDVHSYSALLHEAVTQGVEVVIIKEKSNDSTT